MKYKITLPRESELTGLYLSVPFVNGIGQTDKEFIADKARIKGFTVETEEIPLFKCPHCEKEYKTQESLDKHIAKTHVNGADADA